MDIGMTTKQRGEIAQGLSRMLADTYLLYLKTHNFHWNVEGPMFQTLHTMFMEQYTEAWNAIDPIAERIRALGHYAPGSYAQHVKIATIKEAVGVPKAEKGRIDLPLAKTAVGRHGRESMAVDHEEGDDAVTDWFGPDPDDDDFQGEGPAEPDELPAPGRSRVLSAVGRDTAAERWHDSEHGPRSPIAHAAPAQCLTCGFFVPLSGELGRLFGACANEYAPDDGRVVSADHGCGAHSEAMADAATARTVAPVIDEFGYDLVDLPGVSVGETVFEPLSRGAD